MPDQIVIVGAGGLGREIAASLKHRAFSDFEVCGFIDDKLAQGQMVGSLQVLGDTDWLKNNRGNYAIILAIGNPQLREKISKDLSSFHFPAIIHPGAHLHDIDSIRIGKGCYIADGCILTTDIIVEDFCLVNIGCSLHHDSYIGKYSVLMPGVRITGGGKIGTGSYISSNCAISLPVNIEENAIIKHSVI